MKQLKDYMHFYQNCEGTLKVHYAFPMRGFKFVSARLIGVLVNNVHVQCYGGDGSKWPQITVAKVSDFYPVLRHLRDMTGEEKIEISKILNWPEPKTVMNNRYGKYSAAMFLFLLSKHFDLFGLIDAGLAIDKTTLQK